MSRRTAVVLGVALTVVVLTLVMWPRTPVAGSTKVAIEKGLLAVWTDYEGRLEAREVEYVTSHFRGEATIVELAAEGSTVTSGDVLVRFDASDIERTVASLKRDVVLAETTLRRLEKVELPLQARNLQQKVARAETAYDTELRYLTALAELAADNLISQPEIGRQKANLEASRAELENLRAEAELTAQHLHPAALEAARADVDVARWDLDFARQQLASTVVRAPSAGIVVYQPLQIGSLLRPVRVGDAVFPNQPFMLLPDLSEMAVRCEVPEAELPRVHEGAEVWIHPTAFPQIRLSGRVASVGSMARSVAGKPAWQKYFALLTVLDEIDPRLRPGMSVTVHILSELQEEALLIPRAAVSWRDGRPFAQLVTAAGPRTREIELGLGNETSFEVLAGLESGQEVLVE